MEEHLLLTFSTGTSLLFGSLISTERDLETVFLFYDFTCL